MKIERIKKSLNACGVYHGVTEQGFVYCCWYDREYTRRCTAYYKSYGHAYRKLKSIGVLTKERYLLHRYG